jgi:hypothetical protein
MTDKVNAHTLGPWEIDIRPEWYPWPEAIGITADGEDVGQDHRGRC